MDAALKRPPQPAPVDPHVFEDLTRRIDSLRGVVERQPDPARLEAVLRDIAQKLDRPAAVGGSLEPLTGMVRDLGQRLDQRVGAPLDIAPLEQALRALGERPIEIDTAPIEAMMRDLGAKLVPAAAPDMRPFEDMLREISQKLDRGAPAADLAAMIRELGQHIDERVGQKLDTRSLEEALLALRDRLDSGPAEQLDVKFVEDVADLLAERLDRRGGAGAFVNAEALAGQIALIHDRLDALQSAGPGAALERRIADLVDELDATRRAMQAPGAPIGGDLAEGFAELRADQEDSDKRTQSRLANVQDILERMVGRLGRLEDEIARVDEARAVAPPRRGRARSRRPAARRGAPPRFGDEPFRAVGAASRDLPERAAAGRPAARARRRRFPARAGFDAAAAARRRGERGRPAEERDQRPYRRRPPRRPGGAGRRARRARRVSGEAVEGESRIAAIGGQAMAFVAARRRPLLLGLALIAAVAMLAVIELRGGHVPLLQKSELTPPAAHVGGPANAAPTPKVSSADLDTTPTGANSGLGRRRQGAARRSRGDDSDRSAAGPARRRRGRQLGRGIRTRPASARRPRRRARSARRRAMVRAGGDPRPADRRIPPRRALRKGRRRDARPAGGDGLVRQGRDRRQRAGDAQSRRHARRRLDRRQAGLRHRGGMVPQGRPVRRARQPVQPRHPLRARARRAAGSRPVVAVVLARCAAGRRRRRPQARRRRRQDGQADARRRQPGARRVQGLDARRRRQRSAGAGRRLGRQGRAASQRDASQARDGALISSLWLRRRRVAIHSAQSGAARDWVSRSAAVGKALERPAQIEEHARRRDERRGEVGRRTGDPDAGQAPKPRQKIGGGDEHDDLPQQAEDHGVAGLADRLEVVRADDLHAGQRQHRDEDPQGASSNRDQVRVVAEQTDDVVGEHLRHKEGDAADHRSRQGRLGDRLDHAARLSGSEIVADDRLRALTDADDRHQDQHHDAIDDAERRDGDVAAEAENEPVEDDHDGAHAELHGERGDADRRDLAHDGEARPQMAQPQPQDAPAAEEESQHPHRRPALADRRRQRRSLDAPVKHEDEDVAENEIDPEPKSARSGAYQARAWNREDEGVDLCAVVFGNCQRGGTQAAGGRQKLYLERGRFAGLQAAGRGLYDREVSPVGATGLHGRSAGEVEHGGATIGDGKCFRRSHAVDQIQPEISIVGFAGRVLPSGIAWLFDDKSNNGETRPVPCIANLKGLP